MMEIQSSGLEHKQRGMLHKQGLLKSSAGSLRFHQGFKPFVPAVVCACSSQIPACQVYCVKTGAWGCPMRCTGTDSEMVPVAEH